MARPSLGWPLGTLWLATHLGGLLPLLWLLWALPAGRLGGDPVPELIHYLGLGGLRLLILCLLVTPLARWCRKPALNRLRRPLGLWAFAWLTLHFGAWLGLDLMLSWSLIGQEIIKRTYILVGFATWLILLALAVTSLPALVRALGRRWKTLHRLIYPAVILGCVHFWWSLKSGWIEPFAYLVVALVILSIRWWRPARVSARPL